MHTGLPGTETGAGSGTQHQVPCPQGGTSMGPSLWATGCTYQEAQWAVAAWWTRPPPRWCWTPTRASGCRPCRAATVGRTSRGAAVMQCHRWGPSSSSTAASRAASCWTTCWWRTTATARSCPSLTRARRRGCSGWTRRTATRPRRRCWPRPPWRRRPPRSACAASAPWTTCGWAWRGTWTRRCALASRPTAAPSRQTSRCPSPTRRATPRSRPTCACGTGQWWCTRRTACAAWCGSCRSTSWTTRGAV
mmetsp:Transcript_29358/g.74824  ORF Transcript_29358/g.74824 Transcript_29358/m.74824 type:complete len:249 (-) Transcript_29358:1070-1816(-)